MILPKIRDLIQRYVDGLKTTSGSIIDPKFLDSALNPYRAEIAYRNFKRDKGLNDIYYQDWNLILDTNLQADAEEGTVIFTVPPWIKLGDFDGLGYVGAKDLKDRWIRIKSPMQLSNMQLDPISNLCNNKGYTYYMPNLANKQIIVYNNTTVQQGTVHAVFADPCDLSILSQDYNKDVDNWPMDEADIVEAIELLKRDLIEGRAYKPNLEMNEPRGGAENPFKQSVQQTPQG